MIYVLILFCGMWCLLSVYTEHTVVNPMTCFFGVWTVIYFLLSFKLYGIIDASANTYLLMLIGFLFFTLGYYCYKIYKKKANNKFKIRKSVESEEYCLRYFGVGILALLCIVVYMLEAKETIIMLLNGETLKEIRELAQSGESVLKNQSNILMILKTLVITPFVMIFQPIVAYDFWFGNKSKILIIFDVIIVVLRVITDGSRSCLIYFVLHFCVGFAFVCVKKKKEQSQSYKLFFGIVLVIGVAFIAITTKSRSGSNTIRYAYYYFTMQPKMLETWMQKVSEANIVGYGMASTHGFSHAFFYLLNQCHLLESAPKCWQIINKIMGETESVWIIISDRGSLANAYVSVFWSMYVDGGILGVIVGMFLYGNISSYTYLNSIKRMNSRNICLYAFILQGLVMSFVRFQFSNIYYAVSFIMIFLFYKKVEKKY